MKGRARVSLTVLGSSRRRHRPSRVGEAGCQAQPNRRRHAKSPTCLPLKRR